MSNRTAQANKAVNQAWLNEQQRVNEGKGTRDWTPNQQRDILERGRAYDDDGKAFQGHHMKSVEQFPEYQGDADNIQFLSREEHKAAHFGDFHIPTNGYYDPVTGQTKDFGDNKYEPCPVIDLSEPVVTPVSVEEPAEEKVQAAKDENADKGTHTSDKSTSNSPPKQNVNKPVGAASSAVKQASKGTKGGGFKSFLGTVGRTIKEHPIEILEGIVAIGGPIVAAIVDSKSSGGGSSRSHSSSSPSTSPIKPSSDVAESLSEALDKINRASPIEHPVSGYDRMQNGKKVHVNPYTRGGKKGD